MTSENYCINSANLAAHELIGLSARVIKSSDASKKGISGAIIDETKNAFEIEGKAGIKKLPKREVVMEFMLNGKRIGIIDCKEIMCKPEDRIKLFCKKRRMCKNG